MSESFLAMLQLKADTFESDNVVLRKRVAELEAALRSIVTGKIAIDATHPMGEGWSMAGRFMEVANRALLSKGGGE